MAAFGRRDPGLGGDGRLVDALGRFDDLWARARESEFGVFSIEKEWGDRTSYSGEAISGAGTRPVRIDFAGTAEP